MNLSLHPQANIKILKAFEKKGVPILADSQSVEDAYWKQGSHPEIVERVWDQLGKDYPWEGRCLVYGRPALLDPGEGIIVAVCYGTAYGFRIPAAQQDEACRLGARRIYTWSKDPLTNASAPPTDIHLEFGEDWLFGGFLDEEPMWMRQACEEILNSSGDS